MELFALTAHELAQRIRARQVTPTDAVQAVIERAEALNPSLQAYLDIEAERAREQARQLERVPIAGALAGVPIGVKDNICVAGRETCCASKILAGFRAPYDATAIARLKRAGAVIVGRLNMDEFAFGSSTENSAYMVTKNPWDVERIPGGSSGGSACAVAADMAIAALGSDTGGSIRQPAAMCGVVGLKPTYGRISRYGLVAFASSLDQIGPVTKDVEDAALLLGVMAGHDPMDSTSAPVDVPDYVAALREGLGQQPLRGVRIGVPEEYFGPGIEEEVRLALEAALRQLEGLGAHLSRVSTPHARYAIATYYLVATAEASSNLARYDGVQYGLRASNATLREMYEATRDQGFGAEVKRRILLGTYALSRGYYDAYYVKALTVRTLIKQDFDHAFERCECLITPTSPTAAFRIGEKIQDPLSMYLSDICTISANLAGVPALSVPCGLTKAGLPIGMQLLARPFEEAQLFRVAHAYEQATAWHRRSPAIQLSTAKS